MREQEKAGEGAHVKSETLLLSLSLARVHTREIEGKRE